jgi:hypothetical protein
MRAPTTPELELLTSATRAQLGIALERHGRLVYSNSLGRKRSCSPTSSGHTSRRSRSSASTPDGCPRRPTLLERLQRRYGRRVRLVHPNARELERPPGHPRFYGSLEARLGAAARKVEPFRRAIRLPGSPARREQSRALGAQAETGMPTTGSTRSARSLTGARRRSGSTSAPTGCRTMRCTTGSTRASAVPRAHGQSSRARRGAPDAGGGNNPNRANAGCIRNI